MVGDDVLVRRLGGGVIMMNPGPECLRSRDDEAVVVDRVGVIGGQEQVAVHPVDPAAIAGDDLANLLLVVELADHRLQRRSEEHTSELQSLMRSSYAVFCLKKK